MSEDRERIGAYVDGEMDEISRRRFESELAADPALVGAVAAEKRLRAALRARFDPMLDEPVSPALAARIGEAAKVAAIGGRDRRWSVGAFAAMAASLALGVVLGTQLRQAPELRSIDGEVIAGGALGKALETQLAAAGDQEVRIGLTFRAQDGAWCRTFEQGHRAGLACRGADGWQLRRLDIRDPAQGVEYRQASSGEIAAAAQDLAAQAPLDSGAERRVIGSGWR